ncbi:hypothetical protein F4808DRAFT_118029 [Astrocystis sublimbata]|nr:hypothetical protein F4808DRAFT_118029 [Astrocystis sublimbata]
MASPERTEAQPPPAPPYVNNPGNSSPGRDHDLVLSLNSLSLSASGPSDPNAPSSPAMQPPPSAASPNTRTAPRSPLTRANLNRIATDAQTTSPGLIRKTSMQSLRSVSGTPSRAPSRRGSSTPFLSPTTARSPSNGLSAYGEAPEERPPRTAASVASAYLAKELELLHDATYDQSAETVVILHDDCYGHRYSRPRASKNLLGTIVERPERIQASILGLSMAYVRLGERHCEGKHPIHPDLDPKTLPNIPFRIHKTARKVAISSTAVTNVHGTKWMDELKIMCDSAEAKLALNGNELRRPDLNRGNDAESPQHLHQGDLYLCSESLNAFEGALGAVCEAVDAVFSTSPHRRAFVAVRPPGHHCSASFPSGFCWVNNVHVGIMHGILNHGLTHAAIIDFDLHHGDGSQAIAWQHNKRGLAKNAAAWKKTSIGYFSVHDINSYPCEYGDEEKVKNASLCIDNAHGQNIWNVHLQEWKSDVEFWRLYQSKYSVLLEKTRNYLRLQTERFRAAGHQPRAAIFLSAGFDASEWEGAGMQRHKVNVPTEFYARLTRDVVRIASEAGLSVDGRVISVLEGGYSDRALCSGVLGHLSGLAGAESLSPKEDGLGNLGHERSFSRRSTLNENELRSFKALEFPYDPSWWSAAELDRFDAAKLAPPPEPKKPRAFTPGNYSSPTQSSSAKMTEVAKTRRSLSSLPVSQPSIPRSPTPPPPDVYWTTAAHELSKLLIPSNRQVDSCTHAELNKEATKARKDRQSSLAAASGTSDPLAGASVAPAAPAAPTRMSLRERKPVSYLDDDDYKSRRRTVAGPAVLATSKASARGMPLQSEKDPQLANRRLSSASTLNFASNLPVTAETSNQPVRPSSSMSVRTQASTATNTKQGRPAAAPRKVSGRVPRAPRKTKQAASKADVGTSDASSPPESRASAGNGGNGSASSMNQPAPVHASNDLDHITNEMKKIKIHVLTKEEKAARSKAKAEPVTADDEPTNKPESRFDEKSCSPPIAAEAQSDPLFSHMETNSDSKLPVSVAAPYQHGRSTPTQFKSENVVPSTPTIISPTEASPSSTPFASSPPAQPTDPTQDPELFIPYQPEGPPPTSIPLQRPVHILEPNTGTPIRPNQIQHRPLLQSYSVPVTPARGGGHGFTATSNIPFSPGPPLNPRPVTQNQVPTESQPVFKTEDEDTDSNQ